MQSADYSFFWPFLELTYHLNSRRAVVSRTAAPKKMKVKEESIHSNPTPQLIFDNTPLSIVMERLQAFYHVKIEYNADDIQHMSFYGEYSNKDHIENILNTIAIANSLKIKQDHTTFTISK